MKKFWAWLKSLFKEQYEVTLWYDAQEEFVKTKKQVSYKLKKISKITDKELKGVEVDGSILHIKCKEPYDFRVRKLK